MSLKRIGTSLVLTALATWAVPARAQVVGSVGRPCVAPGTYLELINKSERAGEFAYGREAWTYDLNAGTGTFTSPSGRVQYKVEMPTVIGPEGAEARMTMTVTGFPGRGGKDGVIGFLGEVEPESQVTFQVKADAGQTKTDTKTFVIKPRANYSEGYDPVPLMRLVGGLDFLYKYRVVRCPPR